MIPKILGLGKFLENLEQYENSRKRSHRCSPHGNYSRSRRRRDVAGVGFRTRPNTWRDDRPNGWPRTCRCGYHLGLCDRPRCLRDLERLGRTGYHYYGRRPRDRMSPLRRQPNHTSPWARQNGPLDTIFPALYDKELQEYPDDSSYRSSCGNISIPSVDTTLVSDYEDREPRRHAEHYSPRANQTPGHRRRQSQDYSRRYGRRRGSRDTEEGLRFPSTYSRSDISYTRGVPTESFGSEDSY